MSALFIQAISDATFTGVLFAVLYLALEPAVRARWPHSIITWNRALEGRFRDPQLASDLLIGFATGAALMFFIEVQRSLVFYKVGLNTVPGLYLLNGTRFWISGMLSRAHDAITTGVSIFFALFILRTLLRRDWLAALVGAGLFTLSQNDLASSATLAIDIAEYLAIFGAILFLNLRFGLVVMMATVLSLNAVNGITLGADWKTWYAPTGFATLLVVTGVALWAFRRALGDRDLLGSPRLS
jgi:serine/threonine-protein kinase